MEFEFELEWELDSETDERAGDWAAVRVVLLLGYLVVGEICGWASASLLSFADLYVEQSRAARRSKGAGKQSLVSLSRTISNEWQ